MQEGARPKRNPKIISREDEERLLYNSANGDIKVINKTAALMWDLCDGEHAIDEILVEIVKSFEVEKDTARKDLTNFLNTMEQLGFIIAGE